MKARDFSIHTGGGDSGDREAPSAIVNASQMLVRWHFSLAAVCLTLAVTVPWFLTGLFRYYRLVGKATGTESMWTEHNILIAAGGAAAVAGLNALCLLRCGAALRAFAKSRLVSDLHRAMRRLRTVWRMAALTGLLIAGALVTALVRNWPS